MGNFVEKVAMLFLLAMIFFLSLVLLTFLDYTGFVQLRDRIPEGLRSNVMVAEYIRQAELNALTPKDQEAVVLQRKKEYVETLLQEMRLESLKISEEKEKLEFLFRELEQEKTALQQQRELFDKEVADYEKQRSIRQDEDYEKRLENLSGTYSKMEPTKAAELLNAMPPEESIAVLKRLKPKSLALILENMADQDASKFVELLQSPAKE
jgi:flagellar motility protein MotE (MotC chaperone)